MKHDDRPHCHLCNVRLVIPDDLSARESVADAQIDTDGCDGWQNVPENWWEFKEDEWFCTRCWPHISYSIIPRQWYVARRYDEWRAEELKAEEKALKESAVFARGSTSEPQAGR